MFARRAQAQAFGFPAFPVGSFRFDESLFGAAFKFVGDIEALLHDRVESALILRMGFYRLFDGDRLGGASPSASGQGSGQETDGSDSCKRSSQFCSLSGERDEF